MRWVVLGAWLLPQLVAGCSGEAVVVRELDSGRGDAGAGGTDAQADSDAGSGANEDAGVVTPSVASCFEAVNDMVVIEAESLPIVDEWRRGSAGAVDYIEWSGRSHNSDSGFGRFSVSIDIATPGLYRLQWRTRIGRGTNTTEHNDVWVRFPDADLFFGQDGGSHTYPKPQCQDDDFLNARLEEEGVVQARCPAGSSDDGYFKVYSSGADDWKWSAQTFDHDAHQIFARFDSVGRYTLELAARADFSQLDRIVIHEASLPNNTVRNLGLAETRCR